MIDWPEKERYTAEDLVEIIRILRRPEGCPWDKVQTHQSIRKNFLEETCEVLEAIDADDPRMLREELGDVLMQVAFHAVLEEEQGRSTFEEICREVCEKLVYRHPHVFASAAGQNAGINGWDALKNKEKGRQTLADELDTVPATLPALMRAPRSCKSGRGATAQARRSRRRPWPRWTRPAVPGRLPHAPTPGSRQKPGRRGRCCSPRWIPSGWRASMQRKLSHLHPRRSARRWKAAGTLVKRKNDFLEVPFYDQG